MTLDEIVLCTAFAGLCLFTFLAGLLRSPQRETLPRIGAAIIGPAFTSIFFLFFYKIRWSIFEEANWTRLHRTFAWSLGCPLYPDPETGPILAAIYGPLSALAYYPATWTDSPFLAVKTGAVLSILFFFAPAFWLLTRKRGSEPRMLLFSLLTFFCFVALATLLTSIREAAYTIHADAPALGLSALACGFIYFKKRGSDWPAFFFSSICGILAVWTKQTALPVLLAIPMYLLLTEKKRTRAHYLISLLSSGVLSLIIFTGLFGFKNMFYHMIFMPGRHAVKTGGVPMLAHASLRVLREAALILGAGVPALAYSFLKGRKQLGIWLKIHRWMLFLIVGIFMAPLSLISHIKVGGSNNTLSFMSYFLLLGITMGFTATLRRKRAYIHSSLSLAAQGVITLYSVILLLIMIPLAGYRILAFEKEKNFAREAYVYALKYPNTAYFPRLPLINLLAEGKIYHTADGLMDREWARLPVSEKQFKSHIPSNLKIIAFAGEIHRAVIPIKDYSIGHSGSRDLPSFVIYPPDGMTPDQVAP